MLTLTQALDSARCIPAMSPPHAIARDLCLLRGQDPDQFTLSGLSLWRMVIAEQLLIDDLRSALRDPSIIPSIIR